MQRSRLVPRLTAIVAVALPAAAFAAPPSYHTLDVALPDGGTAQIRYVGNVPPSLTMRTAPPAPQVFTPVFAAEPPGVIAPEAAAFAAPFAAPFAALERMTAIMEQQQELMLREATLMSEGAITNGGADLVQASDAAPGACFTATRVVMVAGQTPKMTSYRSSGCGGDAHVVTPTGPVREMGPIADPSSRLIETRADESVAPRLIR